MTMMTTTSCDSIFKRIWPYIFAIIRVITHAGAAIHIAICFISVLIIIIAAYKVHSIIVFLDDFTGLGVGSQINSMFGLPLFLVALVFVLLVCGHLYVSVILCRGLDKNDVECIIMFIIEGVLLLGIRVWAMDSSEYHNFPEDKTLLYCGLYGLYLVLLGITCVEIRRTRRAVLTEIATTSLKIRAIIAKMRSSDGTTIVYDHV